MSHGLDTLASLRRSGRRPQSVSISLHIPAHSLLARNLAEMNAISGDLCWCATVDARESIGRLDLRPLQGLLVTVDGIDEQRVDALAAACLDAGASRVIASVIRFDQHGCHTERWTDSEGVLDAIPA